MSRLSRIKSILVDLSGTLHVEDNQIPGAAQALNRLRESSLKVRFVTNTTKESKNVLLERLTNIGFNISKDEVFTSLTAAYNIIKQKELSPLLLLDERAMEEFNDVLQDNLDSVIIGLAPEKFTYEMMNKAFRLLMDGAPLIAVHKGRYYRRKDGLALGPGPFVTALEYATETTATVVGKPEKTFFTSAIEDLQCLPEECIMIGDDVRDDVHGAQEAGMLGILVKTGKYRDGDEIKITPAPHKTLADFPSAVQYILDNIS